MVEFFAHPAVLAAIVAAFGGIFLKVTERLLNTGLYKRGEITELQERLNKVQDRLDIVEAEVTFWRGRFYEEQEDNALLRTMMIHKGLEPPLKKVTPPEKP